MTLARGPAAADAVVALHVADVTYPEGHPLAGKLGPVLAFAIRGDGVVLVDTGVVEGNAWIDEHYQPQRRAIRDALRGAGIDPTDVRLVINTHLHFDHCGGNAAFAGVPIVVQRAELHAAREVGDPVTGWVDFPGARYQEVHGDAEVAPGVSVLATPGHTVGHQSVTVRTAAGLVLIVGQASQDARSFATGEADPSVRRLRGMNAEQIHFSHDRAVLRRRPTPPAPAAPLN